MKLRNGAKVVVFTYLVSLLASVVAHASIPRAPQMEPVRIRVRLADSISSAKIRGFDLSLYEGTDDNRKLVARTDRVSEWNLSCAENRVQARNLTSGRSYDLRGPASFETPAGFLRFRGNPYRDVLSVHSIRSFCEVVNHVELEKYLDGLVNSEFSANWSEEAIAAQVIVARTYAYHQILEARRSPKKRHFDVDSTTKDQVYDGSVREDYRASRSVDKTRGLVLTSAKGPSHQPLKSFYHSTCGGMTELPQNVWGARVPGFGRNVRCLYCGSSPRYKWELDLTTRELTDALLQGARQTAKYEGPPKGWPEDWERIFQTGRLLDLRLGQKNRAGRIQDVTAVFAYGPSGSGKAPVELGIPGPRFRNWLGASRLRSTAFLVLAHSPRPGEMRWHFEGQGNGHGVGMCQWGAKVMGEKGLKTAQILGFYYPDAVLKRVW